MASEFRKNDACDITRIIQFLRTVFNDNCKCFEKSCRIEMSDAISIIDSDLPNSLVKLVDFFKDIQNEQHCVTIFDFHENDHCKIIESHLDTFEQLRLITFNYHDTDNKKVFKQRTECRNTPSRECRFDNIDMENGKHFEPDYTTVRTADGKPLTWENLKSDHDHTKCFCTPLQNETFKTMLKEQIEYQYDEEHIHFFACILFWYFRKAIVDHLIQLVASRVEKTTSGYCKAVSVGSTRITSDYDITVQGECVDNIVNRFNDYFYSIFGAESGTVFDTNLYGSSFVFDYEINKKLFKPVNCSTNGHDNQNYYIANVPQGDLDESYITDQHLFGLLKVFISCAKFRQNGQNSNTRIYDMISILYDSLKLGIDDEDIDILPIKKHYIEAPQMTPVSPSRDNLSSPDNLSSLGNLSSSYNLTTPTSPSNKKISYETFRFSAISKTNKYTQLLNLISSYNVFGNETYFTRGAFMDVVFNTQTCKGSKINKKTNETVPNQVALTSHDLLDSFVENFGDFVAHQFTKDKYRLRMLYAFTKATQVGLPFTFDETNVFLKVLSDNPTHNQVRLEALIYLSTLLTIRLYIYVIDFDKLQVNTVKTIILKMNDLLNTIEKTPSVRRKPYKMVGTC